MKTTRFFAAFGLVFALAACGGNSLPTTGDSVDDSGVSLGAGGAAPVVAGEDALMVITIGAGGKVAFGIPGMGGMSNDVLAGSGGMIGAGGARATGGALAMGGATSAGGAAMGSAGASGGNAGSIANPDGPPRPIGPDAAVIPPPTFLDAARFEPPPPAPAPVVDACTKLGVSYCQKIKQCAPTAFRTTYTSDAHCIDVQSRGCKYNQTLPGTGDSIARAEQCSAAVDAQTCADWAGSPPLVCRVPQGIFPEDALCNTSSQCQTGFCNLPITLTAANNITFGNCGRCAKTSPPDGPCTFAGGCPAGASCFFFNSLASGGQCILPKKMGDACTSRDFCDNGRCVNGSCAARTVGSVGADCRDVSCDSRLDLYCNNLTIKCDRTPLPAKIGEYCGTRRDGTFAFVQCEAGAACTGIAEGGFVRTCEAASGIGGPCAPQDPLGKRCLIGLSCSNGVCTEPVFTVCK